jgi:hypothetical protein
MLTLKSFTSPGSCPYSCFDMPSTTGMIWAWAVGTEDLQLIDGA